MLFHTRSSSGLAALETPTRAGGGEAGKGGEGGDSSDTLSSLGADLDASIDDSVDVGTAICNSNTTM